MFPSGNIYRGRFENGLHQGFGEFLYTELGEKYVGFWERGKKHGSGQYLYQNKYIFTGNFENDKRHGLGQKVMGERVLVGNWERGVKEGVFKLVDMKGEQVKELVFRGNILRSSSLVDSFKDYDMLQLPNLGVKKSRSPSKDMQIKGQIAMNSRSGNSFKIFSKEENRKSENGVLSPKSRDENKELSGKRNFDEFEVQFLPNQRKMFEDKSVPRLKKSFRAVKKYPKIVSSSNSLNLYPFNMVSPNANGIFNICQNMLL